MSRIVVADVGPLIALARIGRIELLHVLYGGAVVPVAVMEELQLDSCRPGAIALRAAGGGGCVTPPRGSGRDRFPSPDADA